MITVEKPLRMLDDEILLLEDSYYPSQKMFAAGALSALRWIRDGGEPPSKNFLFDIPPPGFVVD